MSDSDKFKTPMLKKLTTKKKCQKKMILPEEKYVEEVSKIIERDFFPDLKRLNAQNEYLDAKEKNDLSKLREIFEKYSSGTVSRSYSNTPVTFDTPISLSISQKEDTFEYQNNLIEKSDETIANNHSLDSFLFKYTSEDNESFQKIIDAADLKLKKKFSKLYEEEEASQNRLCDSLKVPAIENQFDDSEKKQIETWSYRNKNFAMYIPDGVDYSNDEKIMFAKNKPKITHKNTRINPEDFQVNCNTEVQNKKDEEKDVNIIPEIPASPLMTWGEIEGTPFKLDGSDTPIPNIAGPSFRINKTSRRETLAFELAEKAAERIRKQKKVAKDTARKNIAASPYIKSLIERKNSMSPAAQRLATLKFGRNSTVRRSSTSSMLRKTTPSPSPVVRKAVDCHISKKTPDINLNITDNLLQIPSRRIKASDFF